MFATHQNFELSSSQSEDETGWLQWSGVRIFRDAPVLLVSVSFLVDPSPCVTTYLLSSLEQVLGFCDDEQFRVEKIQLLDPTKPTNRGWTLHDIVHIRTGPVPRVDPESAFESRYREEYHSAEGRCFTFSKHSDEDAVRESFFESVYVAAD